MNKTSKFRWGFRPQTAPPKVVAERSSVDRKNADTEPLEESKREEEADDKVYIKKILTSGVSGTKHTLTDDGRGTFAQIVFPDISPHSAGRQVAADIRNYPELKKELVAAGYVSGARGYTSQQRTILTNFYKLQGRL